MPTPHTPMPSSNHGPANWSASADQSSPYFHGSLSGYQMPVQPQPYRTTDTAPLFHDAELSQRFSLSPSPHPAQISRSPSRPTVLSRQTTMVPSADSSTASPSTASTGVKPVVINCLAKDFSLTEYQCHHLHLFVEVGFSGGLSMPDVVTWLFALAVQFNLHNLRFEGDQNTQTMADLLEDLKTQLNKGFDFTKDQRNVLLKEKDTIGFKNVFSVPSREHLLRSEIHVISSSVRNRMREDIRDSLKKTLAQFTVDMNKKYRRSGSSVNHHLTTARNSVFRRFVAENQDLVWTVERPPGSDSENQQLSSTEPPNKKRKLPTGRSAKGEDFWSKVDEYFRVKIEEYQLDNLLSESWKAFIDQTLAFDKSRFQFLPIAQASSNIDSTNETPSTMGMASGPRALMALLN
ncbi:hypothetical protein EV421DRAFT_1740244 [Armillaria borealis]|uniref:Uncharacterized protein n=1 Tax=Armillaria borealis TaxID=47425 RepID=A0AA39J6W8_9AGAR|nr:hypothetical protein EV421DRAFT_1740244 [Armillaria borealis]